MDSQSSSSPPPPPTHKAPRPRRTKDGLSYKFQRLRERLRAAVAAGELSGKLPGERALARRFHVNAKTLSKALTDLAAEGLLDRSIGRGTYVKGSAPGGGERAVQRWLIVCEPDGAKSAFVRLLLETHPNATLVHDVADARPSFLRQFDAVIDAGRDTPESFLRDLVVRNVPVLAINREPGVFSVNTIGTDRALGAAALARDLALGGHHRFAVVASLPRSIVPAAFEQTARRYHPEAQVTVIRKDQVLSTVDSASVTAVVCDSTACAREVRAALDAANVALPTDLSLAAVGCCEEGAYPCSGHYVESRLAVQTVVDLLKTGCGPRPAMLWLAPRWVDQGTTGTLPRQLGEEAA
jgi:hypothetical protein